VIINVGSSIKLGMDCDVRVVALPFGSLEYHGGVMPYNTDTVIAEKILVKCLETIDKHVDECIYVFPAINAGLSHEWLGYPGSLSLDTATFISLVNDIVKSIEISLKPSGYIFLNAHGGNSGVLNTLAKELYMRYGKLFIIIDVWRNASRYGLKYCHACIFEAMLYKALTGLEVNGIDKTYCRDEGLDGYYKSYEPGVCGEMGIDINVFIGDICNKISDAVMKIKGFEHGRGTGDR